MNYRLAKKIIVVISFTFIAFLTGCGFNEDEIIGWYAPINYTNTFDTIQIQPQGKYQRRVYDKSKKLVLEMDGKWEVEYDAIHFESPYFLNFDRDIDQFPELLKDTLTNASAWLDRKNGTIMFCVGYFENQNCYLKLN